MSASNKKKLRKEQEAAKLTEKQLTARQEAKKTSLYTIGFVAVMVVLLLVAITVGINQTLTNSGVREKNTVALTVGDHELSSVELNYFYMDAINTFNSNYGSYAYLFGLNTALPLDEQVYDAETGETWADYFLDSAVKNATAVYAMADTAATAGFTMPEDAQASVDATISNLTLYSTLYGYPDVEQFLQAQFGKGATIETYKAYCELVSLTNAYYSNYATGLTYDDAALRAAEADNFSAYSSFSYSTFYIPVTSFLEGGTTAEDGTTTYSDDERAAAVTAAENAAKVLTAEHITTVEELDAAITAMSIETAAASSTASSKVLYGSLSTIYSSWLADASRKEGDLSYFPNTTTATTEDGTEASTVTGYYVVRFSSRNDNDFALANVRHLLVKFTGGITDSTTGTTTYTDEEKNAAKTAAEEYLKQWQEGDATEDSFAALANEHSADGDGTTGGLYEDVYPNQMVVNFNDWCFSPDRKPGDTGIVETEYGYHVMFYVGDSDTTYRDYMIENELREADVNAWYDALVEGMPATLGDTKYINTGIVIGG